MKRKHNKVSSDVFLILASLAMALIVWMIAKESELSQQTLSVPVVVDGVPTHYAVRSVRPVFMTTGEPAKGYELASEITPADPERRILVMATPRVFEERGAEEPDALVGIETEPISLDGLRRTTTVAAKLDLPEDVFLVPGHDRTFEAQVPIGEIGPKPEGSQ